MNNIFKRFASMVLVLALFLSMIPGTVFAEEIVRSGNNPGIGGSGKGISWTISNGTLRVEGYANIVGTDAWEDYREEITNLEIGNGIQFIGSWTFYSWDNLKTMTIPRSVKEIGINAFSNSNGLTDIYYGGTEAMWNEVVINEKNWLDDVTIHFREAGEEDPLVAAEGDCGEYLTWKLETDSLGASFLHISGFGKMYDYEQREIPWLYLDFDFITFDGGVTFICDYAFYERDSLTSILLPDSVTSVGDWAFAYCDNLQSVTTGNNITTIGEYAFYNCTNLSEVTISNSLEAISRFAFSETAIKELALGDNVKALGQSAFGGCEALENVTLGSGLLSIGPSAFAGCASLKEIVIPSNVKDIGVFAFASCASMEKAVIDGGGKNIEQGAFQNCTSLTDVTISGVASRINGTAFNNTAWYTQLYNTHSDGVIYIGNVAYDYKGIFTETVEIKSGTTSVSFGFEDPVVRVIIPEGVEYVHTNAFASTTLREIYLPSSLKETGSWAFGEGELSADIYYSGTQEQWEQIEFGWDTVIYDTITLHYQSGICGDNLKWKLDSTGMLTISGTGAMWNFEQYNSPWYHYAYNSVITAISFDGKVTTIGDNAFQTCNGLKNMVIPDSVTSIGHYAFWECYDMESLTIPNSVTSLGYMAFRDCSSLRSVVIPDSVTGIPDGAFLSCWNLQSVTIPDSVTFIGYMAFFVCNNLREVRYGGTKAQRDNIEIEGFIDDKCLENATWYYAPCAVHSYTHEWDTTCNDCGVERSVSLSKTAPTSFKTNLVDHDDVKLTWKAGKGANRYYVYYRRAGKTDWKRAGITTGLTYTIKDLVANGKYEFKVISYLKDSSGTYKGAGTSVLACSTTRNLSAPSKVTVKLYGYDDVQISWSKVTYANGYKVYYKRSTAKSYSYVGFTTGTSIKKANLSDGVGYTFKVVPCTKVNGSYFADDSSKTATVTTLKAVSTPKVAKYASSKVKISWTDIAGESGYQIVVTSDKAGKKVITSTATTGKSKVVSAKKGVTYYYKVRAYKTVDGKKIYAPWSAVKAYKLK